MPAKDSSIDIVGFSGMNNVKEKEGFYSAEGVTEPRIILNADVDQTGGVFKRPGVTKAITLANGTGLWAGLTCSLFVDGGTLYRFTPPTILAIGNVGAPATIYTAVDMTGSYSISN